MTLTVVVADDHAVVRLGLRSLFEVERDFKLIGEAAEGTDVLPLVERLQPDVLILDLVMPGQNGLDLIRQVTERFPRTRVVVLSMHADRSYVASAVRNGACGYVTKGSDGGELIRAVREAAAGRKYFGPAVSAPADAARLQVGDPSAVDAYDLLTAREREILQLAAEGLTSVLIAKRLFISPRTVETHRANLMHKLGLKTPADLVRYALRRGIVPL
jgi:two-component system, NarL family, response regulator NreC